MSNIQVSEFVEQGINVVARSEEVSRRGIQVASPIDGDKQIIDFGFELKNLTLTVYSNQIENFREKDFFQFFSDKYAGEIKAQDVNISMYSAMPYAMINITAIGEEIANDDESKLTKGINYIRGLDNYYNISFSTTNIENIGTSSSISIAHKKDSVALPIEFTYNGEKFTWGNKNFKLIGIGKNLTRTSSAYTLNFNDPLNLVIQKTVIISNISKSNSMFMKMIGNENSKKVTFFYKSDLIQLILNTLLKGKIGAFINKLIDDDEIKINSSKESLSPIVKMLQKESGNDATGQFKNMFYQTITEPLLQGGIFSVGSVLSQILPIFGLEIYYENESYSLEPPRFLFKNKNSTENIKLTTKDVINITVEEPKITIPSIIIPRIDFQHMALSSYVSKCSEVFAQGILKELSKIKDLPLFKIKTFDVPNILVPTFYQQDTESLFNTAGKSFRKLWAYYSAFSFKSTFNEMHTGSIELVFNPKIVNPYKWYEIDGKFYFITDITHSITRNNATTSLRFSGIYDDDLYNSLNKVISTTVKSNSEGCIEHLKKKVKNTSLDVKDKTKLKKISLNTKVNPNVH